MTYGPATRLQLDTIRAMRVMLGLPPLPGIDQARLARSHDEAAALLLRLHEASQTGTTAERRAVLAAAGKEPR